jgi:dTDP-4-amino-4,6-dideoxygalactose transaminase
LLAIAAHAAGVQLVLCDTAASSCEFDIRMLERICDDSIAAIVPTDLAGLPVDLGPVREIAKRSGTYIIEDAAQALGAKRDSKPLGSDADFVVYSLAYGKGLSLFDGGIISVRDECIRAELRKQAQKRIKKNVLLNIERIIELVGLTFFYNPTAMNWFYGKDLRRYLDRGDLVRAVGEHFDFDIPSYVFDSFRKRVGVNAFSRLPEFVQSNRSRALKRIEVLKELPGLKVLQETQGCEGSWPFLMLLADSESQRDAIMNQLWRSGLGVTRLFIHQLSDYDYLRRIVPQESMPNAKDFAARSFSIGNSHWLDEQKFEQIVSVLEKTTQPSSMVSCL